MNIFLTGATGFLGSNLVRILHTDHQLFCSIRNQSNLKRIDKYLSTIKVINLDKENIETYFESNKIDMIIHAATDFGRKQIDPSSILETNLLLPFKLLNIAVQNKVKYFVNTDKLINKKINIYGTTKSNFKEILSHYIYQIQVINVSIEHIYGEDDDDTKFLTFVTKKLLDNAHEINLTLGEQIRDFIYIEDVATAFQAIIHNIQMTAQKDKMINIEIGSGFKIAIKHVVDLCAFIIGNNYTKLKFGYLPYRENEQMDVRVDLSILKNMNWKPNYSLIEGVKNNYTL